MHPREQEKASSRYRVLASQEYRRDGRYQDAGHGKKKLELAVTLLLAGIPILGILEKTGFAKFPSCITKYLFCSPTLDYTFRCLPSDGGLYDQQYRDFLEFTIIENCLKRNQKNAHY